MAALDFPDNPTNGQVFDKWTWNGTMWVLTASGSGGGGSGFTFNQDATPTATKVGDTWYETDTGDSFVWTNDGNSTQWVQFAPGSGGGGGSGFTYVTDTKPTPSKVGDTWFDTSTTAAGGTSWVAVLEGAAGSELVWVQTSPGAGGAVSAAPKAYYTTFQTGPRTDNGPWLDLAAGLLLPASVSGNALLSFSGQFYSGSGAMAFMSIFEVPGALTMPYSAHNSGYQINTPSTGTVPQNAWTNYQAGSLWTPITKGAIPACRVQVWIGTAGWQWYMTCRIGVLEIAS